MKRKSVLLGTVIVLSLLLLSYVNQYANALGILEPPTNLTARAVSSSEIDLRWTAPSDLGGLILTGYKIQRSTDGGSSWSTIVSNTGSTATTYSNTGLAPSTTYTYRVFAITPLVTSSPSNTASATTFSVIQSPQPPTGLTATAASSSQISLSWTAPTDNGGSPITGYKIYRSTSSGTETAYVNLGNVNSYTNTIVTPGVTYFYKVAAINALGVSPQSNEASATAITVPTAPQNLQATAGTTNVTLSWNTPSNNGGSAITGYKIERSTNSGSTWSVLVSNTGSTGTTYSNTGLSPDTTYLYRVSAINSAGTSSPSNTASATTNQQSPSITLVQSGLAGSDSLTNETRTKDQLLANQRYWTYGGSATVQNAPYDIFKDSQGLHIGVRSLSNGSYSGFYGVTPDTSALLFHSVITTFPRTVPNMTTFYENGLYVQTSTQNVNYVTCYSDTSFWGTVWAIASATGDTDGITQFHALWYDKSPNQPLTRDCTIITNGQNYLKVYLDGVMVYSNSTLNLQMPGPFNAFLEPQTSYDGQMLYGIYKDYYSATDENVKVSNLPTNAATVSIVDSSGNILATAPITGSTSILDVGKYHLPLTANIKIYDSSSMQIASTQNPIKIFGGDVYSAK